MFLKMLYLNGHLQSGKIGREESDMSLMFDTAIQNFYTASIGRSPAAPINTVALGLQQLTGAIRQKRPNSPGDTLFQTANTIFTKPLSLPTKPRSRQVALGLQQLTQA